ncbi:hypothetical protein XaavBphi31_09 [Xanthomonas phage Xaa_vB_phi31]|uniref:Uncharacterized protein n=1 Tax=Xanthomonas phage Xaa_vB_phi31 TaxID=2776752 RepID=A0A868BZN5_9CAUD|nr:hypothetical protein XaavBphi31_09 [Xanthomonas phage Xaa_vB_phi31]
MHPVSPTGYMPSPLLLQGWYIRKTKAVPAQGRVHHRATGTITE